MAELHKALTKEKISAEQIERNRWCEMLGVTQDTE